jgi:hypothetical protein
MKSMLIVLVCVSSLMLVDATPANRLRKRQGAAAAVSAAAAAAQAASELTKTVSATLTSGSGNMAYVRWVGDLTYTVDLAHGKTVMNDANAHGGIVAVTKRDSALIGAEANVVFSYNGAVVGKVYLSTYYSGATPTAEMVIGQENFAVQNVVANGSAALIIAFIPPATSDEVTNYSIPYASTSASNSYNEPSSSIQS